MQVWYHRAHRGEHGHQAGSDQADGGINVIIKDLVFGHIFNDVLMII